MKMLLLHLQSSMQGPGTCPADTAACAPFSLVVLPGRSSSWVLPSRPILSSEDAVCCLWLLTFLPLCPLWREQQFLGFLGRCQFVLAQKCPGTCHTWAGILRSSWSAPLGASLSDCPFPRAHWGEEKGRWWTWWWARFGSMVVLEEGARAGGGLAWGGLWWRRIENTGGRPGLWKKMKDQKNEELQMSQPFSFLNDRFPLLESVALHAGLACSFFTADGSVWCSWAALHTDFLFSAMMLLCYKKDKEAWFDRSACDLSKIPALGGLFCCSVSPTK